MMRLPSIFQQGNSMAQNQILIISISRLTLFQNDSLEHHSEDFSSVLYVNKCISVHIIYKSNSYSYEGAAATTKTDQTVTTLSNTWKCQPSSPHTRNVLLLLPPVPCHFSLGCPYPHQGKSPLLPIPHSWHQQSLWWHQLWSSISLGHGQRRTIAKA